MAPNTQDKKEEFQNDFVHVKVQRKPNCVVEYEVEAFRPICIEAHKKAAKSVGKDVVVPGFRKGKAPHEIVAKRYPQELDKRWQENIANRAFQESAGLANVPLVRNDASITFNMHSHSRDGAKLTLSFETVPVIPTIDPAKCVLDSVKRPEVSKEKVEETIRQARMFFSKWKAIEPRPIQEGDFLIMDVDVIEEEPAQNLFSNTRFEVSDRSMAQWMKQLVLGKKPQDVVEGVSVPDETLSEEEKKEYPPKKVRLTIKAIEEAEMPPLDDSFAKQLGVESVSKLQERIEALLNKKADQHVREELREQVTEFLLSHKFEIPNSVIEKETQFRLQQMVQDPNFKKKWDESNDQQKRELVDSVKQQAERAVRVFYVCRKIAADQNMNITPKDLPMGDPDPIEALLYPSSTPHDPRQPDVKQAEAYSQVLLEKTEDFVIAHARKAPEGKKSIKEKVEPEEQEKEDTPKKKAASKKSAEPKATAAPKKKATSKKSGTKKEKE